MPFVSSKFLIYKSLTDNRRGQIMILASMALGGALLGISALAGLLMTYQIRQTTDLTNSTKSIMAADSGVEWGLYQYFHPSSPPIGCPSSNCDSSGGYNLGPYADGASVVVTCYGLDPSNGTEQQQLNCSNASSVQAVGEANFASRSFRTYFQVFAPPQ
ncbi:MAG: hypothetical protein KGJ89_00625 [Patescibacteria group bacterium]|nr:hypothetical protein [Patescibacteria group bacterium]MDE2015018.1 hypothetical protein [Patescibacteria group bacterium]MDE2226446.1 hypothetical protein [Patescibacteria group bacterium]